MPRKKDLQVAEVAAWAEECREWTKSLDNYIAVCKSLGVKTLNADSSQAFGRARDEMRRVIVAVGSASENAKLDSYASAAEKAGEKKTTRKKPS